MKTMERDVQVLPPPWCSSICKNSMNDFCVEGCAIRRDTSHFEPADGVTLNDLPKFPLLEAKHMKPAEKFTAVAVYLSKLVEHAKGEDYELPAPIRPHPYHSRTSRVSEDQQKQVVLHGAEEITSVISDWKEHSDKDVRPSTMAKSTD